jgi:hypothetical protein
VYVVGGCRGVTPLRFNVRADPPAAPKMAVSRILSGLSQDAHHVRIEFKNFALIVTLRIALSTFWAEAVNPHHIVRRHLNIAFVRQTMLTGEFIHVIRIAHAPLRITGS